MGVLRLFLALCVVAGHAQTTIFGLIPPVWSAYAVFLFFIVSGFYMALVLDGRYKDAPVSSFYASRAARIYPAYLVSLALALVLAYVTAGPSFFAALGKLSAGQAAYVALANLLIFGQDFAYLACLEDVAAHRCMVVTETMLNAPGWSIAVELLFYVIAPWAVRTLRATAVFTLIGAAYIFATGYVNLDAAKEIFGNSPHLNINTLKYYLFPASFMFFGAGALAYHLVYKKRTDTLPYWLAVAGVFIIAKFCDPTIIAWWQILAYTIAAPSLFRLTKDNGLDRMIGEISYPVYILHFPIITALHRMGYMNGTVAALIVLLAAALLHYFVERRVDVWRHSFTRKVAPPRPQPRPASEVVPLTAVTKSRHGQRLGAN